MGEGRQWEASREGNRPEIQKPGKFSSFFRIYSNQTRVLWPLSVVSIVICVPKGGAGVVTGRRRRGRKK